MGRIEFICDLLERFNILVEHNIIKNSRGATTLTKAFYLFDVVLAFIVHGSTLTDYFEYEFYKKRHYERSKFITFRRANRIFEFLNDSIESKKLRDKYEISLAYDEFMKRDWLYMGVCDFHEFESFCQVHSKFMVKPRFGSCGKGVYIQNVQGENLRELFSRLKEEDAVLDELIDQHPKMASLHPHSVNTVRVTTVLTDLGVEIMNVALRMGNDGSVIDNHAAGGLVANVDIDTGVVYTTGIDRLSNRYAFHPVTGEKIVGFEIPYWEEIVHLINEIAMVLPKVRYVGWDVAITSNGPVLIEGNDRGMMDVQQQADQVGKLQLYKNVMKKVGA